MAPLPHNAEICSLILGSLGGKIIKAGSKVRCETSTQIVGRFNKGLDKCCKVASDGGKGVGDATPHLHYVRAFPKHTAEELRTIRAKGDDFSGLRGHTGWDEENVVAGAPAGIRFGATNGGSLGLTISMEKDGTKPLFVPLQSTETFATSATDIATAFAEGEQQLHFDLGVVSGHRTFAPAPGVVVTTALGHLIGSVPSQSGQKVACITFDGTFEGVVTARLPKDKVRVRIPRIGWNARNGTYQLLDSPRTVDVPMANCAAFEDQATPLLYDALNEHEQTDEEEEPSVSAGGRKRKGEQEEEEEEEDDDSVNTTSAEEKRPETPGRSAGEDPRVRENTRIMELLAQRYGRLPQGGPPLPSHPHDSDAYQKRVEGLLHERWYGHLNAHSSPAIGQVAPPSSHPFPAARPVPTGPHLLQAPTLVRPLPAGAHPLHASVLVAGHPRAPVTPPSAQIGPTPPQPSPHSGTNPSPWARPPAAAPSHGGGAASAPAVPTAASPGLVIAPEAFAKEARSKAGMACIGPLQELLPNFFPHLARIKTAEEAMTILDKTYHAPVLKQLRAKYPACATALDDYETQKGVEHCTKRLEAVIKSAFPEIADRGPLSTEAVVWYATAIEEKGPSPGVHAILNECLPEVRRSHEKTHVSALVGGPAPPPHPPSPSAAVSRSMPLTVLLTEAAGSVLSALSSAQVPADQEQVMEKLQRVVQLLATNGILQDDADTVHRLDVLCQSSGTEAALVPYLRLAGYMPMCAQVDLFCANARKGVVAIWNIIQAGAARAATLKGEEKVHAAREVLHFALCLAYQEMMEEDVDPLPCGMAQCRQANCYPLHVGAGLELPLEQFSSGYALDKSGTAEDILNDDGLWGSIGEYWASKAKSDDTYMWKLVSLQHRAALQKCAKEKAFCKSSISGEKEAAEFARGSCFIPTFSHMRTLNEDTPIPTAGGSKFKIFPQEEIDYVARQLKQLAEEGHERSGARFLLHKAQREINKGKISDEQEKLLGRTPEGRDYSRDLSSVGRSPSMFGRISDWLTGDFKLEGRLKAYDKKIHKDHPKGDPKIYSGHENIEESAYEALDPAGAKDFAAVLGHLCTKAIETAEKDPESDLVLPSGVSRDVRFVPKKAA